MVSNTSALAVRSCGNEAQSQIFYLIVLFEPLSTTRVLVAIQSVRKVHTGQELMYFLRAHFVFISTCATLRYFLRARVFFILTCYTLLAYIHAFSTVRNQQARMQIRNLCYSSFLSLCSHNSLTLEILYCTLFCYFLRVISCSISLLFLFLWSLLREEWEDG